MIVSAPASSANLGPGFDCLGMALDMPFELAAGDRPGDGWLRAEPTHPAALAFVASQGDPASTLWWRSAIPPGRGLGFSGAARVAGAYLGARHRCGNPLEHDAAVVAARRTATELEGHADNAAASALGGMTVAVDDVVVGLPVPDGVELLVWWPESTTSTRRSRETLSHSVSLSDATFSIGRAALWVASLAVGDLTLLRTACEDRIHQPSRLAARPDVADALGVMLDREEVLAAWLSGSGPTVAALIRSDGRTSSGRSETPDVEGLPPGRTRRLAIDSRGVHVEDRGGAGQI